jgi:peptide/nickel transport system permease protein
LAESLAVGQAAQELRSGALQTAGRFVAALAGNYIVRRFAFFLFVVWLASTVIFLIPRLSGQDPVVEKLLQEAQRGGHMQTGIKEMAEAYRERFGLDKPLWVQYKNFMSDLARLDLGPSITSFPRSVNSIIADSIIWTAGLLTTVTIISFVLGTLAGALLGWPPSPRYLQYLFTPLLTLSALPYYLLALLLVYFLAFRIEIFPLFGGYNLGVTPSLNFDFMLQVLSHSVLPAMSIILASVGFWALGMRGMMVTNQGADFMVQAEAKGLKSGRIFLRYALRNALLPQTTALALSLGTVLTGAVLVEVVFRYPGLGETLFQAIRVSDFFIIRGMIFTVILTLALATFIVDIAYPLLDPRVRNKKA